MDRRKSRRETKRSSPELDRMFPSELTMLAVAPDPDAADDTVEREDLVAAVGSPRVEEPEHQQHAAFR